MDPDRLPLLGALFPLGERDFVFDALMVLGPIIILIIVIWGRSLVTTSLAAAYVVAFPVYIGYKAALRHFQ